MGKQNTEIVIDIADWIGEWNESEHKPKTQTDIIDLLCETDLKPTQVARLASAARQQGQADDDILPSDKLNLMTGAAYAISQQFTRAKERIEYNGHEYNLRSYVGTVRGLDSDVTFVGVHDPAAVERAEKYLFNVATGHIFERLLIIANNGGDLESAVKRLHKNIDEMEDRLNSKEPVKMKGVAG